MKKIFLFIGIVLSLSPHAIAWGDMADNGVECSVIMEKTTFDARAAFPDIKLVFINKSETPVRLFDDFYPLKEYGPNISIDIWRYEGGKKLEKLTAWYRPPYRIERVKALMNYITLNPGEKYEVPINDVYLLLTHDYTLPLLNGRRYVLEVQFRDEYGTPGIRRVYVGKKKFDLLSQSPKRCLK